MFGSRKKDWRYTFYDKRAAIKGAKLHSRNKNFRKTH